MDVMSARRRIIRNNPHLVTLSDTGILNFETDMKSKVKECKVHFSPIQEGSGDPSPDNVRPISGWTGVTVNRAGANLFNKNAVQNNKIIDTVDGNKLVDFNGFCVSDYIPVWNNQPVYIPAATSTRRWAYDKNKTPLEYLNNSSEQVYTPNADGYIRVTIATSATDTFQIIYGSTPADYEPYQGATCPVTFPATGKNLIDISESKMRVSGSTGDFRSFPISLQAGTYTISAQDTMEVGEGYSAMVELTDGEDNNVLWITRNYYFTINYMSVTFTVTAEQASQIKYLRFRFARSGATFADIDHGKIMIESGSAATAYEPYNSAIYGGYVDLVSGALVAEWTDIILDGSESWIAQAETDRYYPKFLKYLPGFPVTNTTLPKVGMTSYIPNCMQQSDLEKNGILCARFGWVDTSMYILNATKYLDGVTDVSTFKTYLSNHPLHVVYKLATPITYQLAPQQLSVLKGTNNVWSNANGAIDLSFWAHKEPNDGLPLQYRRVEYLESTGMQYIDTGIVLNKGCIIAVTFDIGDLFDGDNYVPYGWRYYGAYGGKQQLYINARRDADAIFKMVIVGVDASTAGTGGTRWYDLNVKNTVVFDSYSEKIYMNGVEIGGSYKYDFSNGAAFSSSGSSVYNPYLFALNNKGAVTAISNRTKIYGYSVKQNNAFVQNFIPCVRKSDNKPGMYDTVSKTFYTNAGTGEFVVPD